VSAEIGFATAARELIDLVDGTTYLTPEMRALGMSDALDALNNAHRGMDNFYNEPVPARRVWSPAGEQGDVPSSIRQRYILTIVEYYLENGYGVSVAAEPYYFEMLTRFSSQAAGIALRLFLDPIFSSLPATSVGRVQWATFLTQS
jgi:hypothetical protein